MGELGPVTIAALEHFHQPIKHDGMQADETAEWTAGPAGRTSAADGQWAPTIHTMGPTASVEVARSEVAPAAPEEPGDEEHPKEDP